MSQRPSGFRRAFFRMPVPLFRRFGGAMRTLGFPWIEVTTRGRKSGRPYTVLLDCLYEEPATGRYFVQAAFGMNADWVRNALAAGGLEASLGGERFAATLEVVPADEAKSIAEKVLAAHPLYIRIVALFMGQRDLSAAGLARWAEGFPTLAIRRAVLYLAVEHQAKRGQKATEVRGGRCRLKPKSLSVREAPRPLRRCRGAPEAREPGSQGR